MDIYRSNINSMGIKKFNNLSKINLLFYNIDNPNVLEIFINMKYLNIHNTYLNKNRINYVKLDYIIGEYDEYILDICKEKNIKYYFLPKEKNLLIIGKVIQSIINNEQYILKYNNNVLKDKNNILLCGLGLISNILINNLDTYNIYIYDNSIIDSFDICNQNILTSDDIGKKKIDFYYEFYKNKKNIFNIDIYNNDEFDKLDIIINTLENIDDRRIINDKCVDFNKLCYDIGIEKSMGHIIPIVPFITNKIDINQYRYKKEYPECKIENPESIEHCIEQLKRRININNTDLFIQELNILCDKYNINTISEYDLENYKLDRIPKLISIAYYISGLIINSYLFNKVNYNSIFINLDNNIEIEYIDNDLNLSINKDFSDIYLSRIIVDKEFSVWDYYDFRYSLLSDFINSVQNKFNGIIFTIMINNKLLYMNGQDINISIKTLCNNKNIKYYKKNIVNIMLTNPNNDTILIPKIYLYI